MAGEGMVYKRTRTRPDGTRYTRYVVQVSMGPRGRNVRRQKVVRTKAEVQAALDELRRPAQTALDLGTYLRQWLDESARPSVSPNTARGYEFAIANLKPIHHIMIGELTPEDIERACNGMVSRKVHKDERGKPLPPRLASPKTVRNAQAMLRLALDQAERRGHIWENPARLVPLRRVPRQQLDALTPERAREILAAVKGDRYEAAYALAMVGLRAGEILGLAWPDVDLEAGTADIRWQLVGSGEKARRAQLKTTASHSSVPLPEFVVTRLRTHKAAQLEERLAAGRPTKEGLVFITPKGYAVNATWLTKHFQQLLDDAGLPRMRLHDLRHGAASLLAGAGVHPRIAQGLLRHATSKTTQDVYTHTTAGQERAAADALDRAIGGGS